MMQRKNADSVVVAVSRRWVF